MIVCTPQVGTIASTEIGFVAFWFMDPFPVKVPTKVNVQRP